VIGSLPLSSSIASSSQPMPTLTLSAKARERWKPVRLQSDRYFRICDLRSAGLASSLRRGRMWKSERPRFSVPSTQFTAVEMTL
jgi:hypothetical protein